MDIPTITKVEIKENAGLTQVYAETDVMCYLTITVENSNGVVESFRSFYPSFIHIASFWLVNDTYTVNCEASTEQVPISEQMNFFAWGQTNIAFNYLNTVIFDYLN